MDPWIDCIYLYLQIHYVYTIRREHTAGSRERGAKRADETRKRKSLYVFREAEAEAGRKDGGQGRGKGKGKGIRCTAGTARALRTRVEGVISQGGSVRRYRDRVRVRET